VIGINAGNSTVANQLFPRGLTIDEYRGPDAETSAPKLFLGDLGSLGGLINLNL
jgi:hypothetical protein